MVAGSLWVQLLVSRSAPLGSLIIQSVVGLLEHWLGSGYRLSADEESLAHVLQLKSGVTRTVEVLKCFFFLLFHVEETGTPSLHRESTTQTRPWV